MSSHRTLLAGGSALLVLAGALALVQGARGYRFRRRDAALLGAAALVIPVVPPL